MVIKMIPGINEVFECKEGRSCERMNCLVYSSVLDGFIKCPYLKLKDGYSIFKM